MNYYLYKRREFSFLNTISDPLLCTHEHVPLSVRYNWDNDTYVFCHFITMVRKHIFFLIKDIPEDDVLILTLKGTRLTKLEDNAYVTIRYNGDMIGNGDECDDYINISTDLR